MKKRKVKLFISDIDGTLTDGTVYYSERGEELKQFSHRDGRAFHLLHHNYKIKCAMITSDSNKISRMRFKKFELLKTVQFFIVTIDKLDALKDVCKKHDIDIKNEVAFIGDDTNDSEALKLVKYKACPADADYLVKKIKGIKIMKNKGGQGAVREFIDWLIKKGLV